MTQNANDLGKCSGAQVMGALGSGRWGYHRKATSVEECRVLDLARIMHPCDQQRLVKEHKTLGHHVLCRSVPAEPPKQTAPEGTGRRQARWPGLQTPAQTPTVPSGAAECGSVRLGRRVVGNSRSLSGAGSTNQPQPAAFSGRRLADGAQSSFRIVPVPRLLVNSALLLLANRSTKNVLSASCLLSPLTTTVRILEVSPGLNVSVPL